MKAAIERLSFAYDGSAAVSELSAELPEGKVSVVIGPSGSGKSTLVRLLAGLLSPWSGRVLFDGRDVRALPTERRDIGLVFQNYALFPHMTVQENVAFGLVARPRGLSKTDISARVAETLEWLHLGGLRERKPHQLSGGERQRVAVARAVAPRPRFLLLDEPLSALDARLRSEVRQELASLLRGMGLTTLYVTHDQEEAMFLADRLFVLNEGRLEQSGEPLDVYRRPVNLFVASFLGETNLVEPAIATRELGVGLNGTRHADTDRVLLRPEDLAFGGGASARVLEARRLGSHDRVILGLDCGPRLLVRVPPYDSPRVGDDVKVAARPGRGHFLKGELG